MTREAATRRLCAAERFGREQHGRHDWTDEERDLRSLDACQDAQLVPKRANTHERSDGTLVFVMS